MVTHTHTQRADWITTTSVFICSAKILSWRLVGSSTRIAQILELCALTETVYRFWNEPEFFFWYWSWGEGNACALVPPLGHHLLKKYKANILGRRIKAPLHPSSKLSIPHNNINKIIHLCKYPVAPAWTGAAQSCQLPGRQVGLSL